MDDPGDREELLADAVLLLSPRPEASGERSRRRISPLRGWHGSDDEDDVVLRLVALVGLVEVPSTSRFGVSRAGARPDATRRPRRVNAARSILNRDPRQR
jgi:hypothetical protein